MKVIVGLGNPGRRYAATRHNVGFKVVTALGQAWRIPISSRVCSSHVGEGLLERVPVRLGLPQTMMNASGQALECLARRWKLPPQAFLIVCDDVSLPLGTIRLRGRGSDGGHKGLQDILHRLDTPEVPRLRVGIGPAPCEEDLTPFVLSRFRAGERKLLEEALQKAAQACTAWVIKGLPAAMNLFNRRVPCPV